MKISKRATPWFGIYNYCAQIYLPESFMLRELDHDRIDRMAGFRDYTLQKHSTEPWTRHYRSELHAMCEFLLENKRARKMVVSHDWLYLYFNDPALGHDIAAMDFLTPGRVELLQYQQFGQANSINLQNPKYSYRTYFRNVTPSTEEYTRLRDYLQAQNDISLSPGLQMFFRYHDQYMQNPQATNPQNKWHVAWRSHKIQDYYFIDHDTPSIISMLGMLYPRLVKKTLPITAYK